MDFSASIKARWHTVTPLKNDNNAAITVGTYATAPDRAPVQWITPWTIAGTQTEVRSWTLTISNNLTGIPDVARAADTAGNYPKLEAGNGMYPGDFTIELSLTIPSQDSEWIKKKLAEGMTNATISTTLDGMVITLGDCRLAMDQSPMSATSGYDEVLTITAGSIRYQASA
ncbi:MAG: hypothetical protein J5494_01620 [Candidatus Methanomethylophilaceae archaeon]|nr:hypothetical protein [Candidatus Methanomethylophilaceae archaeon]